MLLAVAAVFACKISYAPDQPVAITIILPDSGRVELTDTFHPRAVALNAVGDSVQADIFWASLDTAALQVLDSSTGISLAKAITQARLQARTGRLLSNPQSITILARLDSIRAASGTRDTVFVTPVPPDTAADSLSDPLTVQAYALGGVVPANRRVVFRLTTFPDSGRVVTFVPKDTVFTDGSGVAAVRVRLRPGLLPDSVVVQATMLHVNRDTVPGSPVTFVVEFKP